MRGSLHHLTGDAKILHQIRQGDEEALVLLYESNWRPILSFILKNNGTQDDAEDLLQECLIVFWEKVRSGRFEQSAQLGTFLFATARNIWFGRLRKRRRELPNEIDPEDHTDVAPSPLEALMLSEQAELVGKALGKIGEPCRKLLLLFYYEELSMNEIAAQLGFANADTAKAKKYQCKKALERALSVLREKKP